MYRRWSTMAAAFETHDVTLLVPAGILRHPSGSVRAPYCAKELIK